MRIPPSGAPHVKTSPVMNLYRSTASMYTLFHLVRGAFHSGLGLSSGWDMSPTTSWILWLGPECVVSLHLAGTGSASANHAITCAKCTRVESPVACSLSLSPFTSRDYADVLSFLLQLKEEISSCREIVPPGATCSIACTHYCAIAFGMRNAFSGAGAKGAHTGATTETSSTAIQQRT